MHTRQAVDFLRRRYAHAILRDDAPTAGRLRDQLDGLMNGKRAALDPRAPVVTAAGPGAQADLFELLGVSGRVSGKGRSG